MPRSRESESQTLSPSEQSPPADYTLVAQEYDTYLSGFVVGDHGRVELGAGEQRPVVRDHLQAAARRRNLALRFRPGRGPLIFYVERAPVQAAAPSAAPPDPRPAAPAPPPTAEPLRPSRVAAPTAESPRPNRMARERPARAQQRPRATRQAAPGRYDDLLPRWMREGQQAGQRRNPRPKRRRP